MEEEFFKREFINCGEIIPEIHKLEIECPDKRTKEYNKWETKINHLFSLYNKMAGFTAFKLFK